MYLPILIAVWLLSFASTPASASVGTTNQAMEDQLDVLASSSTWHRLLHVREPRDTGTSTNTRDKLYIPDIISEGFYLSGDGPVDPRRELTLTLALLSNISSPGNPLDTADTDSPEPQWCAYPSRVLWLQKVAGTLFETPDFSQCSALMEWASLSDVTGLSIVQVSGYFANPGSAFGHIILQANTGRSEDVRGLLDLGINFGASVPQGENMFSYIAKGLFGGYDAAFSDQEFYAQDRVYSAIENRDMWVHRLNLSDYQTQLILFHLWELKDARFEYYFLLLNCGYHIAELLELALDESFDLHRRMWYPPIEVFLRLEEIDSAQRKLGHPLITDINFIPSNQRSLYHIFDAMSDEQKQQVRSFVDSTMDDVAEPNIDYPASTLDFLLQYIDYKTAPDIAQVDDDKSEEGAANTERWRILRQRILLQRLKLPAGVSTLENKVSYDSSEWDPPMRGPRPGLVSAGITRREDDSAASFEFAPYSFNALQRNKGLLKDASFELGRLSLLVDDGDVFIDKFNVIKVEKLTSNGIALKGERQPAWFASIGVEQPFAFCKRCIRGAASVGYGQSRSFGSSNLMFGLAESHVDVGGWSAGLSFGVILRPGKRLNIRVQSRALGYLIDDQLARTRGVTQSGLNLQHDLGILYSIHRHVDLIAAGQWRESGQRFDLSAIYRF